MVRDNERLLDSMATITQKTIAKGFWEDFKSWLGNTLQIGTPLHRTYWAVHLVGSKPMESSQRSSPSSENSVFLWTQGNHLEPEILERKLTVIKYSTSMAHHSTSWYKLRIDLSVPLADFSTGSPTTTVPVHRLTESADAKYTQRLTTSPHPMC